MMLVLTMFASNVYATTYNYDSFIAGEIDTADYGTKENLSDNITNLKGSEELQDGMHCGPYSKASKAKLADGIEEEAYIELDLDNYANSEFFSVTLGLQNAAGEYVSEALVMTQKTNDEFHLTTTWDKDFDLVVKKSGIYTYKWNIYTEGENTYVEFSLLDYGELVGKTKKIDLDEASRATSTKIPIAKEADVSVKYLWFCGIDVANGVNVYAQLPEKEKPAPETPEQKPADKEKPSDEDQVADEEEPVKDSEEKDATPNTGINSYLGIAATLLAVSSISIIALKKNEE